MKKFKFFAIPYLIWLSILIIVPVFLLLYLSLTKTNGLSFNSPTFTLKNFNELNNPIYLKAMLNSIFIATYSVIVCFLIGYPVAYFVSFSKIKNKMLILLCLILPMWSNMLLRIVAWEKIFYPKSILNSIGISLDLIGTMEAVVFVNAITYLPFMIFPIFTILEKMDRSLIEASNDLGVSSIKTFFKVTFPLSLKGVSSGVVMVFLPTATGFAITERIGGGKILLIGNVIENLYKQAFNYNLGALISLFLAIVMIIIVIIFQKIDKDGELI